MPEASEAGVVSALNAVQVPTTIYDGQVTLTAVAQALSAVSVPIKSVTIENPNANAVVYMGNSAATVASYRIQPGATASMDIDNLNKVYVLGTVDEIVSYFAVN